MGCLREDGSGGRFVQKKGGDSNLLKLKWNEREQAGNKGI